LLINWYYSGEAEDETKRQCFLFIGEEEIHPGICEQILDFFTSLFRIINRSSYIGTNIIMMVSTFLFITVCRKRKPFFMCFPWFPH
jgi:hypothetical protein